MMIFDRSYLATWWLLLVGWTRDVRFPDTRDICWTARAVASAAGAVGWPPWRTVRAAWPVTATATAMWTAAVYQRLRLWWLYKKNEYNKLIYFYILLLPIHYCWLIDFWQPYIVFIQYVIIYQAIIHNICNVKHY